MNRNILITGARGNIGRELMESLKLLNIKFTAGVSNPAQARDLTESGINVKLVDYSRPETLENAFRGVEELFLLLPFREEMQSWGIEAVRIARKMGVDYVLRASALGARTDSGRPHQLIHGSIDAALEKSGMEYTIMRPNVFMQNYVLFLGKMIRENRALYLPQGEGRISVIDVADIGRAAAEILANPEPYIDGHYDLTGPKALSNHDIAAIISSVAGETITYYPIDEAKATESMRGMGMSDWTIDFMLGLSRFIREGGSSRVTGAVEDITGVRANTFKNYARECKDCWKAVAMR